MISLNIWTQIGNCNPYVILYYILLFCSLSYYYDCLLNNTFYEHFVVHNEGKHFSSFNFDKHLYIEDDEN